MMQIGFVGAGKVGFSLGRYFCEKGLPVIGYASRRLESAREAARFTGTAYFSSAQELVEKADCIFLTVPDDAIGSVWRSLDAMDLGGKLICHCSGSLPSTLFDTSEARGGGACSLHPLMAIPDCLRSWPLLEDAAFFLEGSSGYRETLHTLVRGLGNPVHILESSKKELYHCAAVFVSNFSTALASIGEQLFQECGLDDATGPLFHLMLRNAQSITASGPLAALTGPAERGDGTTIRGHLDRLSKNDRLLYCLLTEKLTELASARHPDRDYGPILHMLGEHTHENNC